MKMLKWTIASIAVWICDHVDKRPMTQAEIGETLRFARLMADEDINRIVVEKPVDYLGFSQWKHERQVI
jgi:hypothetical protein